MVFEHEHFSHAFRLDALLILQKNVHHFYVFCLFSESFEELVEHEYFSHAFRLDDLLILEKMCTSSMYFAYFLNRLKN